VTATQLKVAVVYANASSTAGTSVCDTFQTAPKATFNYTTTVIAAASNAYVLEFVKGWPTLFVIFKFLLVAMFEVCGWCAPVLCAGTRITNGSATPTRYTSFKATHTLNSLATKSQEKKDDASQSSCLMLQGHGGSPLCRIQIASQSRCFIWGYPAGVLQTSCLTEHMTGHLGA
jgi:hypothetical protein